MASRREKPDCTLEEFNAWLEAEQRVAVTNAACQEEGGPSVSFVPKPTSCPLDFPTDAVSLPARVGRESGVGPFKPEPSRKTCGWSADRQRLFSQALAEAGSVHVAARHSGL